MKIGIRAPLAGLSANAPVNTPVFVFASAARSTSVFPLAYARYAATAVAGSGWPSVHAAGVPSGHAAGVPPGRASATSASTSGCSGATTMYVAPNTVSGRVVNTRSAPASVGKSMYAPVDRPIQLRCITLIGSGQSTSSRSSASRSAYAVIRISHCRMVRWKTGKLPRSERPSAVTSASASTVPRPGHQLTGASATYASRWSSMMRRRSISLRSAQSRPSAGTFVPSANAATRLSIGRARSASGSYQELNSCRKIHWVHR